MIKKFIKYLELQRQHRLLKNEFKKRKSLPITSINKLSQSLPPFMTKELNYKNDCYGNGYTLKKYANVPSRYKIKAVIEHAITMWGPFTTPDLKIRLPAFLLCMKKRYKELQTLTSKKVYCIGPQIAYAEQCFDEKTIQEEKQRLKDNLVVFVPHSCSWTTVTHDINSFCEYLKNFYKDFQNIRICLYWQDVDKMKPIYEQHGFECITAGYLFDQYFLSRLKFIIESASVTASVVPSSQIVYSIFLNTPHFIIPDSSIRFVDNNTKDPLIYPASWYQSLLNDPVNIKALELFNNYQFKITQEQKDFIDELVGYDEVKTPKEVKHIFDETEQMYKKGDFIKYDVMSAIKN